MAFNGSGTFSRLFNWVTDKGNAVPVTASRTDSELDGFATGLSNTICKDGQTVTTARVPFVLGTSAMQGAVGGVSYSFTSDLDTGLYSPTTDQVAIAAGGVQIVVASSTALTVPAGISLVATTASFTTLGAGGLTVTTTASAGFFTGFGAMPVGSILDYAGSSAPSGWLLCFGQSLLRATYPALFTAIGTTYGAADGTHFTLPDCRGRLIAGKDDMGGSAASRITSAGSSIDGTSLGAAGGAQTVTISQANLPAATLTTTITDPGHTHSIHESSAVNAGGANSFVPSGTGSDLGTNGTAIVSATTGITASTALGGSGTATNKMPPAIVLNKIIFAGV